MGTEENRNKVVLIGICTRANRSRSRVKDNEWYIQVHYQLYCHLIKLTEPYLTKTL